MPGVVRSSTDKHVGHASPTPNPFHQTAYTGGSPDVIVNTKSAIRVGDATSCGDPATGGSPTVVVNTKKVHRQGDATGGHGSWIPNSAASGSADVIADSGISAPGILFPDLIHPETQFGSREHEREVIETINDVPNAEVSEYGDGGISKGDGDYNQPNTDNEGTEGTGVPAEEANDDPGRAPLSGDGLNFLPHTDPRILPELRDKLVLLAKELDTTLTITSAYRSPEYNKRVKGAKKSMHVQGKAVDIVQTGYSIRERQEFIRAAHKVGLTGIGVYNTFTHIDIGGKRAWGSPSSFRHLYKFPWAQETLKPLGYRVE